MNYEGIKYNRILLYQKNKYNLYRYLYTLQSLCILYTYKLLIEINRYIGTLYKALHFIILNSRYPL